MVFYREKKLYMDQNFKSAKKYEFVLFKTQPKK